VQRRPAYARRVTRSTPPRSTSTPTTDTTGPVSKTLFVLAAAAIVAAVILFSPVIGSGEFTGRCQDGWDTPSSGGPGTCSWHGGEAHAPKRSLWDVLTR
jgi:hypothetical protein